MEFKQKWVRKSSGHVLCSTAVAPSKRIMGYSEVTVCLDDQRLPSNAKQIEEAALVLIKLAAEAECDQST